MKLVVTERYEEMSRRAADMIAETVRRKPEACLCLAAGSSPVGTFRYMVEDARSGIVDYAGCRFIGLDEWVGLLPTDEGSCRKLLQDELFTKLSIADTNIHFFDGSADPASECARINRLVARYGGLDLVLVGIGMNGHLGFNEPGVAFDLDAHVIELDETTRTVGQKYFTRPVVLERGITLGIRQILAADTVIMIANGAHKADIVKRTWESEVTARIPSTALKRHASSWMVVDREAAAALTESDRQRGSEGNGR